MASLRRAVLGLACSFVMAGVATAATAAPVVVDIIFTPIIGDAPTGTATYDDASATANGSAALTALSIVDPNTDTSITLADTSTALINFDASSEPDSLEIEGEDPIDSVLYELLDNFDYFVSEGGDIVVAEGTYSLEVVPEPASAALLLGSAAALAWRIRRTR